MKKAKKPVFFIVFFCILALAYLTFFGVHTYYGDTKHVYIKGASEIRWGIDIKGGVNATFEPAATDSGSDQPDIDDITNDDMDAAKTIIEQRLVGLNITDSEVYVDYTKKRIMVSFPWQAGEEDFDPESAVAELGETAMLTFRKGQEQTGEQVLTGKDVKKASAVQSKDKTSGASTYAVSLQLNDSGKKAFADATTELSASRGQISIWMDETCITAPNVNEPITDGSCEITGNFTWEQANSLANKINAGALPFKLSTTSTNIISASLGEGALNAMLLAGVIAFGIIAIYMMIFYRLPGFVASIALFGQVVELSPASRASSRISTRSHSPFRVSQVSYLLSVWALMRTLSPQSVSRKSSTTAKRSTALSSWVIRERGAPCSTETSPSCS